MAVSVTSKGQVTIPKRVRDALGITPGSKVEFDVAGGGARLKLVKRHASSRVEEAATMAALADGGWAVRAGERYRLKSGPAVRITTGGLAPRDADHLAAALAGSLRPERRRASA